MDMNDIPDRADGERADCRNLHAEAERREAGPARPRRAAAPTCAWRSGLALIRLGTRALGPAHRPLALAHLLIVPSPRPAGPPRAEPFPASALESGIFLVS